MKDRKYETEVETRSVVSDMYVLQVGNIVFLCGMIYIAKSVYKSLLCVIVVVYLFFDKYLQTTS